MARFDCGGGSHGMRSSDRAPTPRRDQTAEREHSGGPGRRDEGDFNEAVGAGVSAVGDEGTSGEGRGVDEGPAAAATAGVP